VKPRLVSLLFVATIFLAGCATGPKFSDVQGGLPKLPASEGRVYFYRTSILGFAVQPGIYLNGKEVGDCAPNGVFFKDLPPGDYEARVSTEVERKVTFEVDKGEEKFIRCRIGMGLFVGHGILELIDPAKARKDIAGLSYVGTQKPQ
jgi:Protein of unknown function (DUF2846)